MALKILKEFYANAADATALVQAKPEVLDIVAVLPAVSGQPFETR